MYSEEIIERIRKHSFLQAKQAVEGPYSRGRSFEQVLVHCFVGKLGEYYVADKFNVPLQFSESKFGDGGYDLEIKKKKVGIKTIPMHYKYFQCYDKNIKVDGFMVVKMDFTHKQLYNQIDPFALLESAYRSYFIKDGLFFSKAEYKPKGSQLGRTKTQIAAYWFNVKHCKFISRGK